ncbi:hypothetical protein NDU88_004877 [Pleurodeles waltl]|uniref:Uncharacterized protein n=1 Tax=Pleurodeles waltl TaxID=8319 RepID=A0AAV7KZ25_PLEWA|nr:hypothetical protein NDU88_004877 [Pleurodeles waltl]
MRGLKQQLKVSSRWDRDTLPRAGAGPRQVYHSSAPPKARKPKAVIAMQTPEALMDEEDMDDDEDIKGAVHGSYIP